MSGLHLVGEKKKTTHRKFFSFLLLTTMSIACYSNYANLHSYFLYYTQTTISFETNIQSTHLLQCGRTVFKRSNGLEGLFTGSLRLCSKPRELDTIRKGVRLIISQPKTYPKTFKADKNECPEIKFSRIV